MYLDKFRIENYRAIRSVVLDCEDGITVLIGENGCGKSSVLNALEACLGRKLHGEKFDIDSSDFFHDFDTATQADHLEIELFFCHRPETKVTNAHSSQRTTMDGAFVDDEQSAQQNVYNGPLNAPELMNESGTMEFSLLLQCERIDDKVTQTYSFMNYQRDVVLDDIKSEVLSELRRLCPFMRIRSAVLQPPSSRVSQIPQGVSDDERSRLQVEDVLMSAYADLLREADYDAEQSLREQSDKLNEFYIQLDNMLKDTNRDVHERVSAPLSPLNSWLHYVSLLRSSGARSVAMLYFAGAFFNARGSEMIGPDTRPIISIEYPEANLHPLMLTSLWNLIDRLPTQMLVTTYCVELLSAIPFQSLRRIVRSNAGLMKTFQVPVKRVNMDDMRRIAYHLRVRRGTALFMRVWLLVEGETEYWLLPEIARSMGFDLWQEGVEFIEFAQCGLEPLVRLANDLGINWFLLCDGDKAGQSYSEKAERYAKASQGLGQVVRLSSVDIEHSFWDNGYADVFIEASGLDKEVVAQSPQHQLAINARKKNMSKVRAKALEKSREVIKRAVKRTSKPGLALLLGKAVTESGLGIPGDIENLIFNAVRVAREAGGGDGSLLENCKPNLNDVQQRNAPTAVNDKYPQFDMTTLSDEMIDDWGYIDSADDLNALEAEARANDRAPLEDEQCEGMQQYDEQPDDSLKLES